MDFVFHYESCVPVVSLPAILNDAFLAPFNHGPRERGNKLHKKKQSDVRHIKGFPAG